MSNHLVGLQGRSFPYHVNTTADHWWPKGLQRLWADPEGYISRVRPSSTIERRKPPKGPKKGFAHKRGGHRLTFGDSPWNHTFEPEFDEIDNVGPPELRELSSQLLEKNQKYFPRTLSASTTNTLVKICFSLIIRSPAFRHRYSHAGKSFGFGQNEMTGTSNISLFWKNAKNINLDNCNSGKLFLLSSEGSEFFFGDGFYDTVFTRPLGWRPQGISWIADLRGNALVPLLPNLCAYLHFTGGGTGTQSHVLPVNCDVASEVNFLTQVYSKEELFFRSQPPVLTQEYQRGEHMFVSGGVPSVIRALRDQVR